MKYTIVKAKEMEDIIILVNDLIVEGWVPQGGICESGTENLLFFQAMIKN